MKKVILAVTILLGCALLSAAPTQAKTINIVTTTTDLKSVAEFIGGDKVEVYSLGKGNQNSHFVQAKPSYMVKAKKADLFIRNGLELEIGYESLILEGSRNPSILVGRDGHLDASMGITPLNVPIRVDRSMGDIHASGNPHYWLDPLNMKIVAGSVALQLSKLSPENSTYFERNLEQFKQKIDNKMIEWNTALAPFKGEKIITYHQSWNYFANRFGFEVIEELEPKPGIPPSPTHLKQVVESVQKESVKVILMENFYNEDAARFVADKTGVNVVVTPLSVGGEKRVTNYIQLIDTIVQRIKEGFENG